MRKLMSMHESLRTGDDIDKLHMPRKGGKGLASIQNCVDVSIERLKDYLKSVEKD